MTVAPARSPLRPFEIAPVRHQLGSLLSPVDLEPPQRLVEVGATEEDVLDPG
jgi:hypothetical protein